MLLGIWEFVFILLESMFCKLVVEFRFGEVDKRGCVGWVGSCRWW